MENGKIKVIFFGDIVGPLGRKAVKTYLAQHKEQDGIDFVIANGENTTHGHGLNLAHYKELMSYGIDVITNGNHLFNSPDFMRCADAFEWQIRPYNLDRDCPGKGTISKTTKDGVTIKVTNLLGRVYLNMTQSNPFYDLDEIISDESNVIHIVDFHAEATAEKRCLAEYADGRVTAVLGTHTHVQTNDAKILNKGTLFMTDVGMNGAYDSVLGDLKDMSIKRTMSGLPGSLDVPRSGKTMLNAILMKIDVDSKKVTSYQVLNEIYENL